MKNFKRVLALVLVLAFAYSFVACSNAKQDNTTAKQETSAVSTEAPSTAAKDTAAADTGKKIVIGMTMNTLNNPFFVDVTEGAKKAAADNGVELIITDAQNQASKQQTDIENLLQKNLSLLIVDPSDSDAIVAGVEAANNKNVPVITIDRASNGGQVISHIGFDAIKSGNIAGEFIAKTLGGKGKVVELQGIMGTNVAQDRSKGFNQIMAKNPNIKIVAKQSADFDRAKAMQVMENILQANPEIDGVYAANDEMAMGALEAIKAAGRVDKIKMIGTDAIDPALEAIRNNQLAATIAEPPFFLGKAAIETALKIIKGEKVEKSVILDSNLVTKDNVDSIKTRD